MTPSEFKAWFDGFTEAFDKTPTQKQWARIKERVAEIDGKPVTERVYVDRYLPYIRPWLNGPYYDPRYWTYYQGGTLGGSAGGSLSGIGVGSNINQASYQGALRQGLSGGSVEQQMSGYNSNNAMNLLGRAEAQAMTQ